MMKAFFPLSTYRAITVCIAAVVIFGLESCNNTNQALIEEAPLISRNYSDAYGRSVVLIRPPQRVVSLAANITEMVYAIDAEKQLIGVSHDSDFPDGISGLEYLVTYPDFDLPGVATLQPDLVLASTDIHDSRISAFFDKYKLNLYFQDYQKLEDIFQQIRIVGQMLGHESNANHLADSLSAMTKAIGDSTAGQIKYNTAIVLGIDPITVVGSKSFMNDLLVKAGAKNAFGILPEKYPTVTAAEFIKSAPEYVIIPTRNDRAWNDLVAKYPEIYTNIPASQNNHIFQMEPDVIVRPGPRIVEGLQYITRVLHPRVNL